MRARVGLALGAAGVALLVVAGLVAWNLLRREPVVTKTVVTQTQAAVLRPFVVGASTCVGEASQRVQVEARRSNDARIPIPLFGDLGVPLPGDDVSYANVVLSSRLCVDGIDGIGDTSPVKAVTTRNADGGTSVVVTVSQAAGVFTLEPRVDARLCTQEDWAANEPCMSLSGGPSNATKIIELLPFTSSGNDLQAIALAAAQVYATNPACLAAGFEGRTGASFYETLLATFQWEAQQQGLAVDAVSLVLLDADGKPTKTWDTRAQTAKFDAALKAFDRALPRDDDHTYDVSLSNDCDTTGFGIEAPDGRSEAPPVAPVAPTVTEATK